MFRFLLCNMKLINRYEKNLIRLAKIYAVVIIAGIGYAVFFNYTNIAVPCIFFEITGLKCPSCGLTRMITALLYGRFHEAFLYNRLLFVMLPVFAFYFIKFNISYIKNNKVVLSKTDDIVIKVMIVILIAFGIIRNIYGL